jgi:hypothetical protein
MKLSLSACVIGCEERGVKNCKWRNPKEPEQSEAQPGDA